MVKTYKRMSRIERATRHVAWVRSTGRMEFSLRPALVVYSAYATCLLQGNQLVHMAGSEAQARVNGADGITVNDPTTTIAGITHKLVNTMHLANLVYF